MPINSLKICISLFVISVTLFSNAVHNNFTYDDHQIIENNPFIVGGFNLKDFVLTEHRPVRTLSLTADYALFGLDPKGYHIQNILWHSLNVLLVFTLISRLSRNLSIAVISSLVFAAHPVHVEAVANISNRSDLLCFFFMLCSILFYLSSCSAKRHHRYSLLIGAVVAFILAVLSKAVAVVVPVIILVMDIYFIPARERLFLNNIKKIMLVFSLFLLYGIYFVWAYYIEGITPWFIEAPVGFPDSLYTSIRILSNYISMLLFPVNLAADHSFPFSHSLFEPRVLGSLLLWISMLILIVFTYNRSRLLSFALFWFILNIIPVLNLIPGTSAFVAERYMYIPSLGFSILAALSIQPLLKRKLTYAMLILAIAFYSINTVKRNAVWKDDVTLWLDTLKKYPYSPIASLYVADELTNKGMPERAIRYYEVAIKGLPTAMTIRNNLGAAYMNLGQYDRAIEEFKMVLKSNPGFVPSLLNMGDIMAQKGDYKAAETYYKKTLDVNYYHIDVPIYLKDKAYLQLGLLYIKMGEKKKALEALEIFIKKWNGDKEYIESAIKEIENLNKT